MNEIDTLQDQLDKHRKNLRDIDDSIKKLNGNQRSNFDDEMDPRKSENLPNRRVNDRKRKLNDSRKGYEDEEEDESSVKKPSIQSSIVSKSINVIKSKEDLIKIQNKDTGSQQRNKRILGVILGTLKQFKTDDRERSNTEQAQQRKELEKKLEIKKIEEKKKMVDEKRKLESEKHKNLRTIEIIETKIHLTECFDLWKNNHLKLKNFIRTKTKPCIFYTPKLLDEKSERLLDESCKKIEQEYVDKKARVEKELKALSEESDALNTEVKEEVKGDDEEEGEVKQEKHEESIQEEVDDLDDEDKTNNVRLGEEDEEEQSGDSVKKEDEENTENVEVMSEHLNEETTKVVDELNQDQ